MSTDRRWYELGVFRILVRPLDTNPAWITHHIYHGAICIAKQLSVPTTADCEYHLAQHRGAVKLECSLTVEWSANHRGKRYGRARKRQPWEA